LTKPKRLIIFIVQLFENHGLPDNQKGRRTKTKISTTGEVLFFYAFMASKWCRVKAFSVVLHIIFVY